MEMILRDFINDAPIKVDLDFGVNSNVVLRSISIEPRMHQGTEIRRNTFMTFTSVNPVTRKAIKEHEYSFFNLNHDSEFVVKNLDNKITKLLLIAGALGVSSETLDASWETALLKFGIGEEDDLDKMVLTLKGAAAIDRALSEGFYNIIKNLVGLKGPLVHFKTTVDKKGYLEIPLFGNFIETIVDDTPTKLKVVIKEWQAKKAAMETKTAGADKLGQIPKLGGAGISLKGLGGLV